MLGQRQLAQVDVHLILRRGDEILLGRRQNTGWADGHWHLPAGHGEEREPATCTLIREAAEEIGVLIDPADAQFAHLVHHHTNSPRVAIFFEVTRWNGEPVNAEPAKCAGWQWFPLDALPEPMIPYTAQALTLHAGGEPYSEHGWQELPAAEHQ